ncbi:MAG: MATE family efflux transporter [Bacilli bacterium]|jgi:putative MATE family efflux protein
MKTENKMLTGNVKKLVWSMGLPMVVSMVLQALYNIVDTAFVINMGEEGINANLALTYVFPVQIFMIAVGVGTGIGINVLLSRSLGEGNKDKVNRTAGNGLFIGIFIYIVFLLFGLLGSKAFISMQANGNEEAIQMGSDYLFIVCTLSFGQVGYTIYERFLLATGKTMYSTIGQIAGALTNVLLDYVFIYPLKMGVKGAAYATILGQCLSLFLDALFHYTLNKEVRGGIKDLLPKKDIILGIFKLGIPAIIMQGLLSIMMLGVNLILGVSPNNQELMMGSFGIYYKIQQIPLFAAFGMSNALISLVSANYEMKDSKRVKELAKWVIIDTMIVALVFTVLFEALANPISALFGLASGNSSTEIASTVISAIRIASIGFIFMAVSVSCQGVLQGLRYVYSPVITSLLRLAIFLFPLVYLFSLNENVSTIFWLSFPIAEILTSIISYFITRKQLKASVSKIEVKENNLQASLS